MARPQVSTPNRKIHVSIDNTYEYRKALEDSNFRYKNDPCLNMETHYLNLNKYIYWYKYVCSYVYNRVCIYYSVYIYTHTHYKAYIYTHIIILHMKYISIDMHRQLFHTVITGKTNVYSHKYRKTMFK